MKNPPISVRVDEEEAARTSGEDSSDSGIQSFVSLPYLLYFACVFEGARKIFLFLFSLSTCEFMCDQL